MPQPGLFTHEAFPVLPDSETQPRFVPGTCVATPDGPRGIETLGVGDSVVTRDGPKRIARIGETRQPRSDWTYDRSAWPVRVPVGSLGNARPMRLSPDQRILLSGETVARICGVPEVSVALGDLIGLRGLIVERPLAELRYHGVSFGIPVVIEAEGVPCEVDVGETTTVDRDKVREAYQAMHSVGEPVMRV